MKVKNLAKGLFKDKKQHTAVGATVIYSPLKGKICALEELPDETFASRMVGDGVAIIPEEGIIVSPVDGEITLVFPTKHALGILSDSGADIMIHIGIDTVHLNGKGFNCFVKEGDHVKVGEKLMEFDLDLIRDKAITDITPIVITNTEDYHLIDIISEDLIDYQDPLLMAHIRSNN